MNQKVGMALSLLITSSGSRVHTGDFRKSASLLNRCGNPRGHRAAQKLASSSSLWLPSTLTRGGGGESSWPWPHLVLASVGAWTGSWGLSPWALLVVPLSALDCHLSIVRLLWQAGVPHGG